MSKASLFCCILVLSCVNGFAQRDCSVVKYRFYQDSVEYVVQTVYPPYDDSSYLSIKRSTDTIVGTPVANPHPLQELDETFIDEKGDSIKIEKIGYWWESSSCLFPVMDYDEISHLFQKCFSEKIRHLFSKLTPSARVLLLIDDIGRVRETEYRFNVNILDSFDEDCNQSLFSLDTTIRRNLFFEDGGRFIRQGVPYGRSWFDIDFQEETLYVSGSARSVKQMNTSDTTYWKVLRYIK